MRIPTGATPEVQAAFREIWKILNQIVSKDIDMSGRRIFNAGDAIEKRDYATLGQLIAATKNLDASADVVARETLLSAVKAVRVGLYAARGSAITHAFELFAASDRNYVIWASDATNWYYVGGTMVAAIASIPGDLTSTDAGFKFYATDTTQKTEYVWTGSVFVTVGGLLQTISDAGTNSVVNVFKKAHITSGTASAGFGARDLTQLENAAGSQVDACAQDVSWDDATAASEDSTLIGYLRTAGAALAEAWRFVAGSLTLPNALLWKNGTSFTGQLAHTNTADRVYTFADANGNMVYESSALTDHAIVLGNAGQKCKPGTLGTSTTVLHGAAAGDPTYSAVVLTTDVSGVLPLANGGLAANTAAGGRATIGAAQAQSITGDTIPLAKITGGGADGSITVSTEGTVTGYVKPT